MRRLTLAVGSGALGIALLAGGVSTLRADESGQVPPNSIRCYYHGFFCSYEGDDYWSGCDPNYPEGWIQTSTAKVICTTYHSS